MRKILGFGLVLTAACLTGTSGTAHGQAGGSTTAPSGGATVPNANTGVGINAPVPGSVSTPIGNVGVGANTAAPSYNRGPAMTGTVPGQPGYVPPATGATGNMVNQVNAPNTYAPGVQQGMYPGTATAATPGYTGRVMPGMGGYNAVNPMGTTMAPGYYYAGTAGMPYATYNSPGVYGGGGMPYMYGATTAYPRSYITPGYNGTQVRPGYVVQRRGLFGRRNRVVYPASPYGNTTYGTYSTSPYGNTTYGTYPSGYTTTTYYSNPGTYSYGTYPY